MGGRGGGVVGWWQQAILRGACSAEYGPLTFIVLIASFGMLTVCSYQSCSVILSKLHGLSMIEGSGCLIVVRSEMSGCASSEGKFSLCLTWQSQS